MSAGADDWRSPKATSQRIDPRILDEGQKAHVRLGTIVTQACSACGSTAEHHVAYVREHGVCVV